MKRKQFKLVFYPKTNSYDLMISINGSEWKLNYSFSTFTWDGAIINEPCIEDFGMINERILWAMSNLIYQDYEFIGIEYA